MVIYTGTGDRGRTSLFSGERVSKSNARIEAYGDLDELNSVIGAVVAVLEVEQTALLEELQVIQAQLLHVGAWLATTPGSASTRLLKPFTSRPAQSLEAAMDRMNAVLPELRRFILPGGHLAAALAHMARTVCRRTERRVIELCEKEWGRREPPESMRPIIVFLNRLSDYLFTFARYCNHLQGRDEVLWSG